MEEQLIGLETAKLAKEKGFDIPTYTAYIGDKFHKNEDELWYDAYMPASKENWNRKGWIFTKKGEGCFGCQGNPKYFEAYTVTTQSLLQKWLRTKGIDVLTDRMEIGNTLYGKKYYCTIYKSNEDYLETDDFDSYEEALEKGLQEGLNQLKQTI